MYGIDSRRIRGLRIGSACTHWWLEGSPDRSTDPNAERRLAEGLETPMRGPRRGDVARTGCTLGARPRRGTTALTSCPYLWHGAAATARCWERCTIAQGALGAGLSECGVASRSASRGHHVADDYHDDEDDDAGERAAAVVAALRGWLAARWRAPLRLRARLACVGVPAGTASRPRAPPSAA